MVDPREESVAVIGAGAAGLVSAHILVQDGFKRVQIITRDGAVGGVWSEERVYPGLTINNVHGEYRFSSMPMTSEEPNNRLSGYDMMRYMRTFADTYLRDRILFRTEVLKIRRDDVGWNLEVQNLVDGSREHLSFKRLILCSGGCSSPSIPPYLSPLTAQEAGFKGLVFHTSQLRNRLEDLLQSVRPGVGHVVIVGGGKSAQDASAYLANSGRKVTVVFETTDAILASPSKNPLPDFIRRSRFLSILAGHIDLKTRLERFLHTTWLGGILTRFIWDAITSTSFNTQRVSQNSPLRRAHSLFWSIRVNDEGPFREHSYHDLVNRGEIKIIAPAKASGYSASSSFHDSMTLRLSNGQELEASAVILATGYKSSWLSLFDEGQADELGISRQRPESDDNDEWHYTSLKDPPPSHPQAEQWASAIYRGIVPAKNIQKRDFAINGAVFTTNNGYAFEVMAHWISSYFLGDDMRIPKTPEDAQEVTKREAAWMRKRHPDQLLWVNESYSSGLKFWTWPQYTDELLEDMGLRSMRSGGNWFTWPFKIIDLSEIVSLSEERRARRSQKP